jgi:hypothetical protein
MSGGSYNYLFGQIEDLARQIEDRMDPRLNRDPVEDPMVYSREKNQWVKGAEAQAIIDAAEDERRWFIGLLHLVGKAAHDIEWVDSCDYGPGDEVEAIRAIKSYLARN